MGRLCEQATLQIAGRLRRRGIDYDKLLPSGADHRHLTATARGRHPPALQTRSGRLTPDGGRIDLALSAPIEGSASVVIGTSRAPGSGARSVKRIFRPFWSSDDAGTGLGLAIATRARRRSGRADRVGVQLGRGSRPCPACSRRRRAPSLRPSANGRAMSTQYLPFAAAPISARRACRAAALRVDVLDRFPRGVIFAAELGDLDAGSWAVFVAYCAALERELSGQSSGRVP